MKSSVFVNPTLTKDHNDASDKSSDKIARHLISVTSLYWMGRKSRDSIKYSILEQEMY